MKSINYSELAATRGHGQSALRIAIVLGLFCLVTFIVPSLFWGDPFFAGEAPIPASVINPPGVWFFNIGIPVASVLLFCGLLRGAIQQKTLTWYLLFYIAGVSCFWVETIADWGIHLTYSPQFWHYELPFSFPWHVEDNPFFMPFAYGLYWTVHPVVVVALTRAVVTRTGWSTIKALFIVGVPFSIVWDLAVEGTSTYFGWWTYEPPIGPHFSWEFLGGRGIQTLVVPPLLMIVWPNVVSHMAGEPEDSSSPRIARLFAIPQHRYRETSFKVAARWDVKYEALKVMAWITVFWVAQVTMLYPVVLIRYLFGGDNIYAPFPPLLGAF